MPMKRLMVIYFVIIAIMFILALLFYDKSGIFVAEGILAGLGLAVASCIYNKPKNGGR